MKTLAIASATIALAFTASPALAGSGELETKSVEFADLNLDTPQGQERLEQRIESAARDVCRVYETRANSRIRYSDANSCLAAARASAKQQVAALVEDQQRGG